jgi:hypothetical protein
LEKDLKEMDIGLLVINAGAAKLEYFENLKNEEVEGLVNLLAL